MKKGIIYKAECINGKCYVGQTIKTLDIRRQEHELYSVTSQRHLYNTKFSRAFRKYGIKNFRWMF